MHIFILALTMLGILVLVVLASLQHRQKGIDKIKAVDGSDMMRTKILILDHIRSSTTAIPKISIIEGLEIPPKVFKTIISKLKQDKLITETLTHVKITTFGGNYYDTFVMHNKGNKWQR